MSRNSELAAFAAGSVARPAGRSRTTPEAVILRDILAALKRLGVPAWRIGAGAFHLGERYIRIGTRGMADVVALPPGRGAVFIEVKSNRGRLSLEQVNFRDACRHAGAVHVVARSVEDVLVFVGVR